MGGTRVPTAAAELSGADPSRRITRLDSNGKEPAVTLGLNSQEATDRRPVTTHDHLREIMASGTLCVLESLLGNLASALTTQTGAMIQAPLL